MTAAAPPSGVEQILNGLRARLHRYCARMTGSSIDGEDIVQEVHVKAIEAVARGQAIDHWESWLFRVAHNAALDHLRRRQRTAMLSDEALEMIADPEGEADRRLVAAASLRLFMELPPLQRSSVVLMDVLGYSADEIRGITGSSIPAIKAALHRGRARLRELAQAPDEARRPALSPADLARLARYADRFNARDFDAVRDMLADDVRLELVSRARMKGRKEVSAYFGNYDRLRDWRLAPGAIDGRPALLVFDADTSAGAPVYFVLLDWADDRIANIRDFRYARYAIDGAEAVVSHL